MIPPVYPTINVPAVRAIVGTPPKIYGFGVAPQGTPAPYVTWQVISGTPSNTLDGTPGSDERRIQIDCWSSSQQQVIDLAKAVRTEMEKVTHMLLQRGPEQESETLLYRYHMDFSFWTFR